MINCYKLLKAKLNEILFLYVRMSKEILSKEHVLVLDSNNEICKGENEGVLIFNKKSKYK